MIVPVAMLLRPCAPEDVAKISDDAPPDVRAVLQKYLEPFAAPMSRDAAAGGGGLVICFCGRALNGFFGSFTWGMAHGEGQCSACGHPARAYHYVMAEDGSELCRFATILLYLPVSETDVYPRDEKR